MDLLSRNQILGGGFSPKTFLGANLVGWWDASNLTSVRSNIDGSGGNAIGRSSLVSGRWDDLTGLNHHLIAPANDARRPTFYWTGGLAGIGLPAMSFDFTATQFMQSAFALPQPVEILMVWAIDPLGPSSLTPVNGTWIDGAAGNTMRMYNDGTAKMHTDCGGGAISTDNKPVNGLPMQTRMLVNGAASVFRMNRGTIDAIATFGAAAVGGLTLGEFGGGTAYSTANFFEIIIANVVLTAGQRTTIEGYFLSKWGN